MKSSVNVWMSDELKEKIDEMADEKELSRSAYLRLLALKEIKNKAGVNDVERKD